ncbi:MAG: DNA polymerase III subunit gamma/tau [Deltaproteobacteria bacterium]|nr:DNA polymerase III subunit gamma/tau [Candidatus Deferrimicrobium borealis]
MAYEALARKWRPKTFEEIVGQGHVTRALANAISSGKIHHAYLFSGTRGVGKTTFARILARALNCEKGPTPTPCLACPSCAEVGSGTDVQEIDGASNTGIDDIRSLRENAAYAPSRLRYKVYIIDEVHMLSKQAFNGLLKTLEEPPPHVVFILATTEPNRIPDTILSRVQRFDFRMLTDAEVRGRLSEMARVEGIPAEEDALALMARYAFGSMRDGQSLFEQAAVSGGGNVTAALVEGMLGLVGVEAAIDLVSAAVLDGAGPALTRFAALLSRGADLKYLFLSLIDVLRDTAVLSFTGQEALLFRHSPASLDRMRELTARRSREEWMLLLDIAFRSERDVLATEFPHLGFELLLLRLANAQGLLSVEALDLSADLSAEAAGAPKAEAVAQKASATPAATFSRRPAPAVDSPVSATVPPVLPTAGVPQQREARSAPLPTPIGGTPPARSSRWGGDAPAAGKTADLSSVAARAAKAEAGAAKDGSAKGDPGLWDAVRRNLEGRKKTVLLGLLSQMRGELREGEFVITCGHEMMLDRLKEKDKWQPLLAAIEEAAGRAVPVRLSVSTEKKSPEPDAVATGDAGLERKALEEPTVLEILRTFEGSMLVKVQPAPPVEVPRNEVAADEDAGEAEIPEAAGEAE